MGNQGINVKLMDAACLSLSGHIVNSGSTQNAHIVGHVCITFWTVYDITER